MEQSVNRCYKVVIVLGTDVIKFGKDEHVPIIFSIV